MKILKIVSLAVVISLSGCALYLPPIEIGGGHGGHHGQHGGQRHHR